jgi:hypothetical protein
MLLKIGLAENLAPHFVPDFGKGAVLLPWSCYKRDSFKKKYSLSIDTEDSQQLTVIVKTPF